MTLNSLLSNAYQKLGLKKRYLWELAWRICRPFLYIFLDHQSGTPTLQCFALFILLLDPKSLSLNCSLVLWHQPMEKVIVSLRCLLSEYDLGHRLFTVTQCLSLRIQRRNSSQTSVLTIILFSLSTIGLFSSYEHHESFNYCPVCPGCKEA